LKNDRIVMLDNSLKELATSRLITWLDVHQQIYLCYNGRKIKF